MATQSKRKRRSLVDVVRDDRNIVAAGLLHDLAILQSSERSSFGYKRAAKALAAGIDRSVVDLIEEGTLRDVPFVGPSSERVVAELVKTGSSASVDEAVNASAKRAEVEKRREFRRAYLEPARDAARARRAAAGVDRLHDGPTSAICRCTPRGATAASPSPSWPRGRSRWAGSGSASPITRTACRSRAA